MNKREEYLQALRSCDLSKEALELYLLENSNLPGKRGNLELAFSFGEYIEQIYPSNSSFCYQFCLNVISEYNAQKNEIGNEEFLPFCSIVALGHIGKTDQHKRVEILHIIKENAKDSRWRIREAVAVAIQELVAIDVSETLAELRKWIQDKNYLINRAIVAGLAEPRLMKNSSTAKESLDIHKKIIEMVASEESRSEEYKVLVQGLCYTLSVIITGIQDEGFEYLEQLVNNANPTIRKIARENLKKNRLRLLNENKVLELQANLKAAN